MTKSSPPPVAFGFTLIEFLVVVAAIGIFAALAVPAFTRALERAKATKDLSNLRQIGLLTQTYLNDKDRILPVINALPGIGATASPVIYPKYVSTKNIFQSPFDKRAPSEKTVPPLVMALTRICMQLPQGSPETWQKWFRHHPPF